MESPGGLAFGDLALSLPSMAQVTAAAWVGSMAWELPHATGIAKKKKKLAVDVFLTIQYSCGNLQLYTIGVSMIS